MEAFEPSGWEGYAGMAFSFDSAAVTWVTTGNACGEAAFKLGVGSVEEMMQGVAWGYGFGPMVGGYFEDTLAGAVGEAYATDWAGSVGLGYLYTNLLGEAELSDTNYTFVYPMAEDGAVDGSATADSGAGDSATPVDGWYQSSGFSSCMAALSSWSMRSKPTEVLNKGVRSNVRIDSSLRQSRIQCTHQQRLRTSNVVECPA